MATSFDFAPAEYRRLVLTPWPLFMLAGLVVSLLIVLQWLRHDLEISRARFEQRRQEVAARVATVEAELPQYALPPERLVELEARVVGHNRLMGGPRRSFARLLIEIARCLPEAAVIAAVENPTTGRPQFGPADVSWRLQVVVIDQPTANALYQRLSASGSFASVGMNPKGPALFQGHEGLAVEVVLKLAEEGA